MANVAEYRFLPFTRRGLAARVGPARDTMPARADISVGVTLTDQATSEEIDTPDVDLTLYGPGDVLGIDTQLVVRTDPVANASDVESNYMPAIEFELPDLPWMFTPAGPDDQHRLRPWLVLVCVDAERVDEPRMQPGTPLPRIEVPGDVAAEELPNLDDSAAWAHTQVLRSQDDGPVMGADLADEPELNVSRLVCPRRLEPHKLYHACLVPAFDLGVQRGLTGEQPEGETVAPAWGSPPGTTVLPVYYHWSFATGPAGDFETLARKLKPFECPPDVGAALMYVGAAGRELPQRPADEDGGTLEMDGALRSVNRDNGELGDVAADLREGLGTVINRLAKLADEQPEDTDPLGPPVYAGWHKRRHTVRGSAGLLPDLNLDPRRRAAAAIGTAVVRRNQEDMVHSAWQQVGDVLAANRLMSLAHLMKDVLERLAERYFEPLPLDRLVLLAGPALPRMPVGEVTLLRALERTSLPSATIDGAMRRQLAPESRLQRKALAVAGRTVDPGTHSDVVGGLAGGEVAPDPNLGFTPDGIGGIQGLGELPLGGAGEPVDLAPLGMDVEVPRTLVSRALGESGPPTRRLELREDLARTGVVTERLVRDLQAAGHERPLGGFTDALESLVEISADAPEVEAFVFDIDPEATEGGISFDPLELEGRELFRHLPTGEVEPFTRLRGRVPTSLEGLELETLVEDVEDTPVSAPLRNEAVLDALGSAVGDLRERFPQELLVDLDADAEVVEFDLDEAASRVLERSDPTRVVPARLRSRLSVADTSLLDVVDDRFDVSERVDRVWAAPKLPSPLYEKLAQYDEDRFLPGVDVIPPNAVTLVETNPPFIEAFMVGVNQEFNSELLWRGYPADRRGTSLRYFWDWVDGQPDLQEPIHKWPLGDPLGTNTRGAGSGNIVLLIRGELLRRYPDASLYAWKADGDHLLEEPSPGEDLLMPEFGGRFEPDFAFAGFELTEEDLELDDGWFFVIAEQPTEPRFGMDTGSDMPEDDWSHLSWGAAGVVPGGHLSLADTPLAGTEIGGLSLTDNAAELAAITLQKPFRAAIHARHMIFEE